jgi:D-serine deaminase-like pyridoxal phosphate-dependent protein
LTGLASTGDLPTPAALIDVGRLERNCARMAARIRGAGVRLRPHVKTHKCPPIGRIQLQGRDDGITVSTLAEARAFARAGFADITWAVPMAPAMLDEAAELAGELDALHLLLDHGDTLDAAEACARRRGQQLSIWLKVDCGYHRAGVDPDSADALELARRLDASTGLTFAGLLTHAGQAYGCRNAAEARGVAATERDAVVRLADRLDDDGIAVPALSVGSTPTMCAAVDLDRISEARPGNYALFDTFQAAIGSCDLDDVAFSVLATVTGRYPGRDSLVIDAGALALSKDLGAIHVDPDGGFGRLAAVDGRLEPRLHLAGLSQEHGKVQVDGGLGPGEWPIGTRLRVLPNHSCLAAALFPAYHAVDGEHIIDTWHPVRGW